MRIAQDTEDTSTDVDVAVASLLIAEQHLASAKEDHEVARQRLTEALQDANQKSGGTTIDGTRHIFTRSSRTTTKVDEKGLRKALGARVFDKFTDKKLNRSKLEKAVEHQEVDPMIVAKYLTQESSEEYITHRKEEADAGTA